MSVTPATGAVLALLAMGFVHALTATDAAGQEVVGAWDPARQQAHTTPEGLRVMYYGDPKTKAYLLDSKGEFVFMTWTTNSSTLGELVTQCIGSAIKVYGKRVVILTNHLSTDDFKARGWNDPVLLRYRPAEVVAGTPMHEWFDENSAELKRSKHWHHYQADFMRYALLYKYGGIGLDTDVLVLRPISEAYRDRMCPHPWDMTDPQKAKMTTEAAIMFFNRGHPYLFNAMRTLTGRKFEMWWNMAASTPILTEAWRSAPMFALTQPPLLVPLGAYFGLNYYPSYDFWKEGKLPDMDSFKGCEVIHTWWPVAGFFLPPPGDPSHVQRVKERLDVLRALPPCQAGAPTGVDEPQKDIMQAPIKP